MEINAGQKNMRDISLLSNALKVQQYRVYQIPASHGQDKLSAVECKREF